MSNTVTNRQIFFILFLTLTTVAIVQIPKTMAQSAGTGSWITIIIVSLIFAVGAYALASLNNLFQGMVLFDYSKELVGKIGSWLLAVYYSLYFFTVLISLEHSLTNMMKANFLHDTPQWFILLATMPVCGYVAYKGVTNVARLFEIYGVIFILITILVHVIMLFEGKVNNILPLIIPSEAGNYISAIKDAIFPFLGIEILTIIPLTEKNGKKAAKTAFLTLLGVGLLYILVVESSIMMVGIDEVSEYNYPMIFAIRLVQLPFLKVFERVDILYLTVGFLGIIAGLSIVYLSIVENICRMLPKSNRLFIVLLVSLAAFMLGMVTQSFENIDKILNETLTLSGIAAALFIPIVLLLVAKVKKHAKNKVS